LLLTEAPAKYDRKVWLVECASEMFTLGGWWEMDWWEKMIVQNGGRALVKPKNQPGGVVLAP